MPVPEAIIETAKLLAQLLEYVTCLECCKPYESPEKAACGHMLCHTCWRWQRSCPTCKAPLDKEKLRFYNVMANLTVLVLSLRKSFETVFERNLDELLMECESYTNTSKNISNWLKSSQNHFSAPSSVPSSSQSAVREIRLVAGDLLTSDIHIHTGGTSSSLDKTNHTDANKSPSTTTNDNIEIAATVDSKNNNSNDLEEDNRIQQSTNQVLNVANINDKNYSIDGNQFDMSLPKDINEQISYSHNCSRAKTPFLKKSNLHNYDVTVAHEKTNNEVSSINNATSDSDDIFISIKIGTKMANITIKKKQNNVQVKDQETQTYSDQNILRKDAAVLSLRNTVHKGSSNNASTQTSTINKEITKNYKIQQVQNILEKFVPTKKLPASADTATVQFEITESVEKELSSIMECSISNDAENVQLQKEAIIGESTDLDMCTTTKRTDYLNDLDIFEYGSVTEKMSSEEPQVQLLKNTEKASSKIIISSLKSREKRIGIKRNRDIIVTDHELPIAKKQKFCNTRKDLVKEIEQDSEPINYDAIMGQVFPKIGSHIEDIKQSQISNKNTNILKQKSNVQKISEDFLSNTQCINKVQHSSSEIESNKHKYSEYVFSILLAEENESHDLVTEEKNTDKEINETPVQIEVNDISIHSNTLREVTEEHTYVPDVDFCITIEDKKSDKSAVEVTPQKTSSFFKPIPNNDAICKTTETLNANTEDLAETKDKYSDSSLEDKPSDSSLKGKPSDSSLEDQPSDSSLEIQIIKSTIINVTDSTNESKESVKDVTIIEPETNVTVNEFMDQIQHKSTPVARKSNGTSDEKFCIAGSCLSAGKIGRVKALCRARGWTYSNKYVKELTHLVVNVDKENKTLRSLKYIRALAAGKWIVNYTWIDNCLHSNNIPDEEPYEVLDRTGDPAPRLSRTAHKKLFEGIAFFCMPPFSRIEIETLKEMLEAAGGTTLNSVEAARVTADCSRPALLLAEPENTQDRFIYIAMELNMVPVNYEWVLSCLGSYTVQSIQRMLLCPPEILPAATSRWPECVLAKINNNNYDV